jgi:hypothetical protein
MAGDWATILGAALQGGGRTFNVLNEQDLDRKRIEQARQDMLAQQGVQNRQQDFENQILMQDRKKQEEMRQRAILDSAITNIAPNEALDSGTYNRVVKETPDMLGRLNIKPGSSTLNVSEGMKPINPNAPGATFTPEQAFRKPTMGEQVDQQKLKSAQELDTARTNFLSGKDPAGNPWKDTPQNRAIVSWALPGVNANEVFGTKQGGAGATSEIQHKYLSDRATQMKDAATKALEQSTWASTGLVGGATGWIPGTPGQKLESRLEAVRSNTAFKALTEMRMASPTGGALGAVSDREGKLLESVFGPLDRAQGDAQLSEVLQTIIDNADAIAAAEDRWQRAKQLQATGGNPLSVYDEPSAAPTTPNPSGPQDTPVTTKERPPVRLSELKAKFGDEWMAAAQQMRANGVRIVADILQPAHGKM